MLDINAIFGPSTEQEAAPAKHGTTAPREPCHEADPGTGAAFAEAIALIDQADAVEHTPRSEPFRNLFKLLRPLVHQYHAAGNAEMLQHSLVSARRMLADMRAAGDAKQTGASGS